MSGCSGEGGVYEKTMEQHGRVSLLISYSVSRACLYYEVLERVALCHTSIMLWFGILHDWWYHMLQRTTGQRTSAAIDGCGSDRRHFFCDMMRNPCGHGGLSHCSTPEKGHSKR